MMAFGGFSNLKSIRSLGPSAGGIPAPTSGLSGVINQQRGLQTLAPGGISGLINSQRQGGGLSLQQPAASPQPEQQIQQFDENVFMQQIQQNPQILNRIMEIMRSQNLI